MSSSVLDRLVSRWLLKTTGILGLASLLTGALGMYLKLQGGTSGQMLIFLGFWGLELALFLGAVTALQALWSLFQSTLDAAPFGFYVLLSITALGGALTGMVAAIAAFLWIMRSPSSVLFGRVAAAGIGVTLLLAAGAFALRNTD